jgi:hypothetical protein
MRVVRRQPTLYAGVVERTPNNEQPKANDERRMAIDD